MKTNYSISTSLPAYHANPSEKQRQSDRILSLIKNGANNLLQLSDLIGLPQSTIAGRVNDLIAEKKVMYSGKTFYRDYTRKKIVLIQEGKQVRIFE